MTPALVVLVLASKVASLEVRVPGPAGTLGGTLTLPGRGRPPFPAVITLTGSGAHHRDGNRTPEHAYRPFRDIANALGGCGIATLRLDDRGVGNRRVERRLFPDVNHHFQLDPVGSREGYDRLPTQDLAPEVLAALCSWLHAALQ